jgi:hypothetical protein
LLGNKLLARNRASPSPGESAAQSSHSRSPSWRPPTSAEKTLRTALRRPSSAATRAS